MPETFRCSIPGVNAEVDYGTTSGSAKGYLERIGVLNARRPRGPVFSPDLARVHQIPLQAPLPPPVFQRPLLGEASPDRGRTLRWPYPVDPPTEPVFDVED